jgi:hypothetical protein
MEYRRTLYEYLSNRMNAIAPNLTIMVGELVGARLISHAGSLLNLAKQVRKCALCLCAGVRVRACEYAHACLCVCARAV